MFSKQFQILLPRSMLCILCLILFLQTNLSQVDSFARKTFTFQDNLSKAGIDLGTSYVGEYFTNLSGGINRQGTYLDNFIFTLGFDMDKLMGLKAMNLYFSTLGINGGLPFGNTGAIQGVSNIAGVNHWKLYEAWVEQNLFNENFSILFGLYDLNSEFDVRESSGIFLNPSFGIGFDFAQSGQNGPSVFPYTSLTLRLKVSLSKSFDLIAAVFDGVPGSLAIEEGLHVDLKKEEGALISAELIFSPGETDFGEEYSKVSLGGWYYTSDFENTTDGTKQNGNYGAYINAEQFVYSENSFPEQGLAVFGRFGIANSNFNPSEYSILGGVNYTGLIPGRDEDVLGLAFTSIHLTDEFKQDEEFEASFETILELTYSFQALKWLRVQPDLQYIINPVAATNFDFAFTAGIRAEVAL